MEGFSEREASRRQLFQDSQRIAEYAAQVEVSARLIHRPESFHIIGVEFEQLPDSRRGICSGAEACSPEPETAPADRAWLLPGVREGRGEFPPARGGT